VKFWTAGGLVGWGTGTEGVFGSVVCCEAAGLEHCITEWTGDACAFAVLIGVATSLHPAFVGRLTDVGGSHRGRDCQCLRFSTIDV